MNRSFLSRSTGGIVLVVALALTLAVYWPGLSGGWLFDDYPNIVDNPGVQPVNASLPALVRAALSSPSSELKRPLASLSFAANYLATGLDPYWMKLTNLILHLVNGWLIFLLVQRLIIAAGAVNDDSEPEEAGIVAALIAGSWLLLPINLTAVLYVVQRMESMANSFVLLGLVGYMAGRQRMLEHRTYQGAIKEHAGWSGFALCAASLLFPTAIGLLAKETAVMLPLYAALVEWTLFGLRRPGRHRDWRIGLLFVVILLIPIIVGLCWLLPNALDPSSWATRDFTLRTRLLSEARIVVDYIGWTLLPLPHALSFYHDDFAVSTGLLHPWTTLVSLLALLVLIAVTVGSRRRHPLVTLGLALFFGCHLLTATILPLELIYEHRNYFASLGLLLVLVPPLYGAQPLVSRPGLRLHPGRWALALLLAFWCGQTATTAYAWGDELRLARALAERAPESPRAQYELGRTYIIRSHYDPDSPYTRLAYGPLERAAALPASSILPQQALIFMNSRMHLPLKETWWDSMIAKLQARPPGVQDESSLLALAQCAHEGSCQLPRQRMVAAFKAALDHPLPSARVLAAYSDYAWSVLGEYALGESLATEAVTAAPDEPAYRITLVRMLIARGRLDAVGPQMDALQRLDVGGRLGDSLHALRRQIAAANSTSAHSTR